MKAEFDVRFLKDIEKIHEKNMRNNIEKVLEQVGGASSLSEIRQVKKLKGEKNYFRIRLGDYRIGFDWKKKH
jgi:mRNA interferase RelE/StbE